MRIHGLLLLVSIGLGTAAVRAEEAADDAVTAHVPKDATLLVRVKSLARAKTATAEANAILAPLDMDITSALFALQMAGVDPEAIDPARPLYFVAGDAPGGSLVLARPADPAVAEPTTRRNVRAEVRDGVLVAGTPARLAAEPRGVPTAMLDGDVAFHIYVGDLTMQNKEAIENAFADFTAGALSVPGLPANVRGAVLPLAATAKEAVFSVESLAYALTWKDGVAIAEGRLVTRPRTPLRAFLKRVGAPGTNPMVGYLAHDAFITFDYIGAPDWPSREIQSVFDRAFGPGTGAGIGAILDPTVLVSDLLTGRVAGSLAFAGLGYRAMSIAELKEGVDAEAVLGKIDIDAVNASLTKAGVPVKVRFERAFGKHGDTELHRLTAQSSEMSVAMVLGATQTFLAVEKGHLFLCVSPTPADDLKALLDRVRAGEPAPHPHARAMARLAPKHNLGLTFNLGALKSLAMLMQMAAPEAGDALALLPDELRLSSAFTFADGDIHWRGDWPVKNIAAAVQALDGPPPERKAEREDDYK